MIKIVVSSEDLKQELLDGSKHIHDLRELVTDIPGANTLAHLYACPELIEVIPTVNDKDSYNDFMIAKLLAEVSIESPNQLEFALQLLGLSPCPKCDFVKKHCNCKVSTDPKDCMLEVLNRC